MPHRFAPAVPFSWMPSLFLYLVELQLLLTCLLCIVLFSALSSLWVPPSARCCLFLGPSYTLSRLVVRPSVSLSNHHERSLGISHVLATTLGASCVLTHFILTTSYEGAR